MLMVGCYLFSLSMAVIIIPYHKVTVRGKQQSYVNGMLGGGLVRAYPQVSLVKWAKIVGEMGQVD